MDEDQNKRWTIQKASGEPLPERVAALVEHWLTVTDGDLASALVLAAEELAALEPAASRGFSRTPPLTGANAREDRKPKS
ncbi:MAG: hypothetical protein ACR65Z_06980 [Methylocystis sp.]